MALPVITVVKCTIAISTIITTVVIVFIDALVFTKYLGRDPRSNFNQSILWGNCAVYVWVVFNCLALIIEFNFYHELQWVMVPTFMIDYLIQSSLCS